MPFRVISPDDFEWITRPHDEGEPARHVAELSDVAGSRTPEQTCGATSLGLVDGATAILIKRRRSSSRPER